MWKKFLKKSGWTDIIVSLIFIIFGIMLISRPEEIVSVISILLGAIFVVMGILKIIDYYSNGKQDNYLVTIATVMILVGIVIMFCSNIILSVFRILIAVWIIYSGIMNLQTAIIWKDYKSRLWILTLLLAIATIVVGIYILINTGAILQTIGIAILIYGIVDIIESFIFIRKIDNYLE